MNTEVTSFDFGAIFCTLFGFPVTFVSETELLVLWYHNTQTERIKLNF